MKVFNSGLGGYICDNCNVLLWAGHTIRHFTYGLTKEQIVTSEEDDFPEERYYCSEGCHIEDKLNHLLELTTHWKD